jgi:hypothetical protein
MCCTTFSDNIRVDGAVRKGRHGGTATAYGVTKMTNRTDPALAALERLRALEDAIPPVEIGEIWGAYNEFVLAVPTSPAGLRAKLADIESTLQTANENGALVDAGDLAESLLAHVQTIKQGLPLLHAV